MASAKFCICPMGRLNIKMPFVMMGIPIIKVQWYNDHLIFIMEISITGTTTFILGRGHGCYLRSSAPSTPEDLHTPSPNEVTSRIPLSHTCNQPSGGNDQNCSFWASRDHEYSPKNYYGPLSLGVRMLPETSRVWLIWYSCVVIAIGAIAAISISDKEIHQYHY